MQSTYVILHCIPANGKALILQLGCHGAIGRPLWIPPLMVLKLAGATLVYGQC